MTELRTLGAWLRRFLTEHIVTERNLARNTQKSYRDTFALLLPFVGTKVRKPVDRLTVLDLTPRRILQFLDHLSVLRLSDGRVLGLFEGFDCRLRLMVPGCRTVVDASSGFAAPPLRSGPSGDPSPSIRRRAAMAVSRAFGHVPITRHNVAMTSGGGCYPLPLPCLSRGWGGNGIR